MTCLIRLPVRGADVALLAALTCTLPAIADETIPLDTERRPLS